MRFCGAILQEHFKKLLRDKASTPEKCQRNIQENIIFVEYFEGHELRLIFIVNNIVFLHLPKTESNHNGKRYF